MKKHFKKKWYRPFYLFVLEWVFLFVLAIFLVDTVVCQLTQNKLYNNASTIPKNKVGVVLGTAKYLGNGRVNLYYKYRINAVKKLYNAGKIEFVLVSGDNSTKNYDEPSTFKTDLISLGIPASRIYLDYAGFRTLDSMVRANKVFGQDKFTVISQKFHNERAIFLARSYGIKAIGYNSRNVSKKAGFKTMLREKFARIKMVIDLIVNTQPKFLGTPVQIG